MTMDSTVSTSVCPGPATHVDSDDPGERPGSARRQRRRRAVLIGLAAAAVITAAGIGAAGLGGSGSPPAGSGTTRTGGTVRVARTTLINATTVDGTLDHGPEIPLGVKTTGTVTWLPAAGTVVRRGEPLLRIDDRPVVLLYGDLPMYRRLAESAPPAADSAPTPAATAEPLRGRDVKQFETNLKDLGYGGFTVDETYSKQTTQAVKRWQKDLGVPQTGAMEVSDVVYTSGPVRIGRTLVRVGAPATGDLVGYTTTDRMVTVNAPVGEASWASTGTAVEVVLPDGRSVPGTVAGVGADASAPPSTGGQTAGADGSANQNPTVPVLIEIPDQNVLGNLNSSPVKIRYVVDKRENVLAVPVTALVALAEGGYGLEVADGGSSRFVAVQTGLFADGQVEVSGTDVHDGMTVRIPQ
ncbi:peptidoglycan-binding protein [Planosporangium mesophilum]|nr:peptidoglycan-binding protein [Planosporangium mesophilum]